MRSEDRILEIVGKVQAGLLLAASGNVTGEFTLRVILSQGGAVSAYTRIEKKEF